MSPKNHYRLLVDGTTELHRVIKEGSLTDLDEMLVAYEKHFDQIKHHLEQKFSWNPNDKIWLRKTILVAATEQECRAAKQLEDDSLSIQNVQHATFVLLLSPVGEDTVAIIYPKRTDRTSTFHLIRSLIPNGFLALNYTGIDDKCESFIEAAASCGNIVAINRLLNVGASLSLPGHNPLLPACKNLQRDAIRWLLTEHFDSFDCTLRTASQSNAFMILMQKNNVEMLDYVLQKMIAYRQKFFNESQSLAFNNIFRYEHEVYTRSSIISPILTEQIRTKIADYIAEYQLDLTYQWKGVTILADLLYKKLALDYCWDGIRKNPELLGLVVRHAEGTTIVHECIRLGILDILREMYHLQPTVKRFFETNHAYETLQQALWNEEFDSVELILDNHQQFFLNNIGRLRNEVIFCSYHRKSFYANNRVQLIKYFPSFEPEIIQLLSKKPAFSPGQDLKLAFEGLDLNLAEPVVEFKINSPRNIRGSNGATLLHYAVEKDNPTLITTLLNTGCDFDAVDNEGNHPIHYVKSAQMFDLIIGQHPDGHSLVHRTNFAGYTVLHKVCRLSCSLPELVTTLIDRVISCGANVNQLIKDGSSALFLISNTTVLETLVRHGIKLDVVNDQSHTALERHFMNRNRKMANALLRLTHQLPSFKQHAHKYFAPMIFSNRVFFTQTYRPFLEANRDTLKTLFDSVYENSPDRASELFNKACCNGQYFVVDNFLAFDYDLKYNFQGEDGSTSIVGLLNCTRGRHDGSVEKLLEKGVDLEIPNNAGSNALLTFAGRFSSSPDYDHSTELAQLLLDYGARLDARDADGNSALHLAFGRGELELVEVFLRNGADSTALNNDGKTPVQMGPKIFKELFYFIS